MKSRSFLLVILWLGVGSSFGLTVDETVLSNALEGKSARFSKAVKTSNSDAGVQLLIDQTDLEIYATDPLSMSYAEPKDGGLCMFASLNDSTGQKFCYIAREGALEKRLIAILLLLLAQETSAEAKHNLRLITSLLLNRDQPCPSLVQWRGLKPGLN